ncbi:hypothetical protein EJB05_03567, partial [Eragrostis curvula]
MVAAPRRAAPSRPFPAMKPVFIARADRESRLDVAAADQRRSALDVPRPAPLPASVSSSNPCPRRESSYSSDRRRDRDRGHHDLDRDYGFRRDRKRGRDRGPDDRDMYHRERDRLLEMKMAAREREKEMAAIKEQYMGSNNKRPKKRQVDKKSRFCFDWDAAEDTSGRDANALYQSPPHLLFGRGFLAGIDRRDQKNKANTAHAGKNNNNHAAAASSDMKKKAAAASDTRDDDMRRHWSEKSPEEMTDRDWRVFRDHFDISYKGGGSRLPRPMRKWSESNLDADLLAAVEEAGYRDPSPIQMAAVPLGLQQRDVIGVAETGSGKTVAFVLPMLSYVARLPPVTEDNKDQGPYALVLAPTRELAQQIEAETVKLAAHLSGVRVVSIVGGGGEAAVLEQGAALANQGYEIMIATPGRLLDLLNNRYVVLNQCNYVVLDEADRMVDSTFEQQVVGVLDAMPSTNYLKPQNENEEPDDDKNRVYRRTTVMFSATMPPVVERLARKYLRNPVVVTVGTAGMATDLVTQNVVMVTESEKMRLLQKILRDLGVDKKAIVFCNTRNAVDMLCKDLDKAGFRVTTLHGGKSQEQREISLDGFRNRRFSVLVATDLAARGIDVPDVAHVINFEMPGSIESYTHRIGRTGRAGKKGVATSFLTLQDTDIFFHLKQMLVQSNSPVPPELAQHKAAKFEPGSFPDSRPPRRK